MHRLNRFKTMKKKRFFQLITVKKEYRNRNALKKLNNY